MPPKKKKSNPIVVVGTVSTRSTRRESIVNIEIVPKSNKSIKSSSKKTAIKTPPKVTTSEHQQELTIPQPLKEARSEILEILRDWSDEDDDDKGNEDIISAQSTNQLSSLVLGEDQQSLIDILEGKQPESEDIPSLFDGTLFKTKSISSNKSYKVRDTLIENPVVNIDSPKLEEPDIIEECVVEDDTIIIELPDESLGEGESSSTNEAETSKSCFKENPVNNNSNSRESSELKQNLKIYHEINEDGESMNIEVSFQNDSDIYTSDNSTNNIEAEKAEDNSSEPFTNIKAFIDNTSNGSDTPTQKNHMKVKKRIISNKSPGHNTSKSLTKSSTASNNKMSPLECKKSSKVRNITAPTDDKLEIQRAKSDEQQLCLKINESMQISDAPVSRMSTKNEDDNIANAFNEKLHLNKIEPGVQGKNKSIKRLCSSENDISPKMSPKASPKIKPHSKTSTDFDTTQIRRSSRNKPDIELSASLRGAVAGVSEKCLTADNNLSSELESKIENKTSLTKTEVDRFDLEATSCSGGVKDTKLCKEKFEKRAQTYTSNENKMDIDSDTKTSEEGDTTSNDSNQDINKGVKQDSASEKETGTPSTETVVNKKPFKVTKLNTESQADSIQILRSHIDAAIDEVLRKYTCDDADLDNAKDDKSKPSKGSKKKKDTKSKKEEKNGESSEEVRRSDRIKTIVPVKKKSHGLVRSKSEPALSGDADNSDSNSVHTDSEKPTPSTSPSSNKVEKVKVKAKSSENLHFISLPPADNSPELPKPMDIKTDKSSQAEIEARLKTFIHLKENQYKTDRQVCKEARGMVCDCYLAEEDIQNDEYGCGEDCLNRLLMIECGDLCQVEGRCTNKRFQKSLFAPVEVFKTEKKGLGLRAAANIAYGEFILEYVGEVLNPEEFDKRAEGYSKDKNIHFYFMSLRADAIIDATMKGNISRFINHSCDPNAETQKWTVNGELRIGFFSTRTILAGEEITFDYRFQRYGKEAQKCYCEAATCRGWLGERPDESDEEEDEEEEESSKITAESVKAEVKVPPEIVMGQGEQETPEKMVFDETGTLSADSAIAQKLPVPEIPESPKKVIKKKPRKEILFEDFDQLNEDIDMLVTTGLKNQAHTLKMSRLMVRAKDLEQRKKLLRILRRGELPCRRLFLDYHGLRLMHGYMIDAQQLASSDVKVPSSELEVMQTKLELLQTLAVLPIQNKTILIESKVLPAVEKWAKNEDIIEDGDQKDVKNFPPQETVDPVVNEKIDEIKFLANKLLEEWVNLKESFRIPKKQRIEQMKEHEKEANRKFLESSYAQEKDSSRKQDQRYRSWSRCKSERESNKKNSRSDDKDRPSAEFLKMSRHERRKLFALQMELKEEERRLKQRELWRQHEMNCLMIGADPRFTAPFDPSKGFQYIWNPSLGQWQALPVPTIQGQGVYNSPAATSGVSNYNVPSPHKQPLLGPYPTPMMSVAGITGPTSQYPGLQGTLPPMVPGLTTSAPSMANSVVSGMSGLSGAIAGLGGSLPGINQPLLPALTMYQEVKQEDPSQVKFAGPIPPPAKLPPKWKCAKDKYGRPYYYHVKIRKSQWEPPPLPEPVEDSSESSSSETSSGTSSDSSSDSDTDDEIDDSKLLVEVRKQMETTTSKISLKSVIPDHIKKEGAESVTPSPEIKAESDEELNLLAKEESNLEPLSSIDIRLKEQFNLDSNEPPKKKRRVGLCQEIIISPRTEEDRKQFKEDMKRYRATKEKLKRQKEQMLLQAKKKLKLGSSGEELKRSKDKRSKTTVKSRIKEMKEWNDENARKIKETFRSAMATTVVGVLNAYRKPDCKEARITNTEDFKHLARKLTHFVMLKEMKHLSSIEELTCTDNVKAKAREYIRKYMSKFGEVYQKRHDEPDFKD